MFWTLLKFPSLISSVLHLGPANSNSLISNLKPLPKIWFFWPWISNWLCTMKDVSSFGSGFRSCVNFKDDFCAGFFSLSALDKSTSFFWQFMSQKEERGFRDVATQQKKHSNVLTSFSIIWNFWLLTRAFVKSGTYISLIISIIEGKLTSTE